MAVLIRIPTVLRKYAGDQAEVQAEPGTLRQVITQFVNENDAHLKAMLLNDEGDLRHAVATVFLNGESVRFLQNLDTPVQDGDEVSIIAAAAGG